MPITTERTGVGGLQLHHRLIIEEGGGSEHPIAKTKSECSAQEKLGLGESSGVLKSRPEP